MADYCPKVFCPVFSDYFELIEPQLKQRNDLTELEKQKIMNQYYNYRSTVFNPFLEAHYKWCKNHKIKFSSNGNQEEDPLEEHYQDLRRSLK